MIGATLKPSNVDLGRVEGRFIVGIEDGTDAGDEPDFIAAMGTIEFTASVPYLPDPTASPVPVTLLKTTIRGMLDSQGYLCSIRRELVDGKQVDVPGPRGLSLVATDDPDLLVQNWTWNVTYRFTAVNGSTPTIPAHGIAVPMGATVDLTTTLKVPSSPGYGLPQSEAAVLRAEAAALDAQAAALDVVTRADAGEFKGDQGLPGNATMRIDTSVGTRVFITNGTIEHMIKGETGLREIPLSGARTGNVRVSRDGNMVTVDAIAISQTASGTAAQIPVGFRPQSAKYLRTFWNFQASLPAGGALSLTAPSGVSDYATFTYKTVDPWPTVLPGTPV